MNLFKLILLAAHAVREHGIVEVFRRAKCALRPPAIPDDFDIKWGTDTASIVPKWSLQTKSPNQAFAARYQPVGLHDISAGMGLVQRSAADLTFIDLGSGKGRALILASKLGFSKVVGVEFASDLVEIARDNLRLAAVDNATTTHGDAMEYIFPPGNFLLFLYNPFGPEVLRPVLSNLAQAIDAEPGRDVYLMYANPQHADLVDLARNLERLGSPSDRSDIIVWRSVT